jgi:hypothetical protein
MPVFLVWFLLLNLFPAGKGLRQNIARLIGMAG